MRINNRPATLSLPLLLSPQAIGSLSISLSLYLYLFFLSTSFQERGIIWKVRDREAHSRRSHLSTYSLLLRPPPCAFGPRPPRSLPVLIRLLLRLELVDRSTGGESGSGPWCDAMVPARNLLRRHCDSYGAYFSGGDPRFHDLDGLSSLKLNKLMADEPSPAPEDEQFGRDDGGSGDWLQLGLGTPPPLVPTDAAPGRTATTQLELFSARPSSSASPAPGTCPVAWPGVSGFRAPMMGMAMTMVPWMSHRREMPWGRCNPNLAMGGSSATTTLPPVMPEFVARQFVYPIPGSATPSGPEVLPEMRVVTPPRRPQSGVWIMLQAARDQ